MPTELSRQWRLTYPPLPLIHLTELSIQVEGWLRRWIDEMLPRVEGSFEQILLQQTDRFGST
jgi:hypothetical protein